MTDNFSLKKKAKIERNAVTNFELRYNWSIEGFIREISETIRQKRMSETYEYETYIERD